MNGSEKFNLIDNTNTVDPPDPFNVAALRLPPSFEQTAGVKKILTTVPVRKPHKQEWIRVHGDEAYRSNFATIHLKEEGEFYLVMPDMAESLRNEIVPVTIYVAINRAGVVFLWPVRCDGLDGHRSNTWFLSAHEAAAAAMKRFTRVSANKALGAYEISYSDSSIPDADPVWPDLPFSEFLRLGFDKPGRFIKDFEHPVIKLLRGL